ncbi:heptaprenyl diphosphate synthase [Dolosicoccus paucivorans]|nr:heptaprenyl diphosphate synthase [Dolosicoccus paucivorans]
MNKPVLEDLSQGVYTLPLLLARQEHKSLFDPYLLKKDQLTEQEAQEVNRYVLKYEGVKKANKWQSIILKKHWIIYTNCLIRLPAKVLNLLFYYY